MKRLLKKASKIIAIFLLVLILLFVGIWIALQQSSVQNFVVDKATNVLTDMLQTKVEIDRVDIDFFKTLVAEGIYIEDQSQDTLAYADRLTASIGLFSLFGQEIHLSEIALEGSRIKLNRNATDSLYNFQFLIDAFAPDTTVVDTTSSAWGIDIDRVRIADANLTLKDLVTPYDLSAQIGSFTTNISLLDLENSIIHIDKIALAESGLDYTILKPNAIEEAVEEAVTAPTGIADSSKLVFPDLGWALEIDKIDFSDNYVTYTDRNYDPLIEGFDVNYLMISELDIEVNDLIWKENQIKTELKRLSFQEGDNFILSNLAAQIVVDTQQVAITDFALQTPKSAIYNETYLRYNEFNDLQDFLNKVEMDIQFTNSELSFDDLNFLAPQLQDIPQINTNLKRDLVLNGILQGTVADLRKMNFSAAIGNDLVLKAKGSVKGLPDVENMQFNINLQELSTSYQGLERLTNGLELPPALADFGRFKLVGQFNGTQANVNGKDITFITDTYTGFKGDLVAKGLPDVETATFLMDINYLRTQSEDIKGFMGGEVPAELERLGQIQYIGTFKGTTTDFELVGDLNTVLGTLKSDLNLDFNADYTDASYVGKLSMKEFDIGKMLGDTLNMDKVTFSATADGKGITPETINTELKAVVESFSYLDYEYKDLVVNGKIDGLQFSGEANIQDENVALDFDGLVNMNDSVPEMRFQAKIDTINFKNLNLTPEPYALSADINSDLEGSNADNLIGDLSIKNLYLSNGEESFFADTMLLTAKVLEINKKRINFDSEIFEFYIEGKYNVADLPTLMTNFVNDFFPVEEVMSPQDTPQDLALEPEKQPKATLPDQKFEFGLGIHQPLELTRLFVPELTKLDTGYVVGNFDSKEKSLVVEGKIPDIEYNGMTIKAIDLNTNGDTKKLKNVLTVTDFFDGGSNYIPVINLQANLYDDSLFLAANVEGDTSQQKLRLGLVTTEEGEEGYKIVLDEEFKLNNEEWKVDNDNQIIYKDDLLNISNLTLSKNLQQISINSRDKANDEDYAPIEVAFANFKLSEISALLEQEDAFFEGKVNGKATLKDYGANLHYNVDLSINEIILNGESVGDLSIEAEQTGGSDQIDILAALSGQNNDFRLAGNYKVNSSAIDLVADFGGVEMRLLDPFMDGLIRESKGKAEGKIVIGGTATQPDINGQISVNEVSTEVEMLGLRYRIPQHTIQLSNTLIDIGQMKLVDENDYEALFSGQIQHEFFDKFLLDLKFRTDRFQVLNTTVDDNELYYGDLFISTNVNITGDAFTPQVEVVSAKTLANSTLFIQPLTYEAALGQEKFVIFDNPATYEQDTTISINDVYQINSAGVDLLMNLEVTPDAELQIIIDPATGDKLVCRGRSNLTVDMGATGDVAVNGNYVLTSGTYSLNYQGILKKEFVIRPGSNITMTGDPLNSRFDITAIYTAKTTTFELIENEATSLSPSETAAAKTRTNIDVLLQVKGTLDAPEISFDIRLPENQANTVSSTVARKLALLKENETELNKQVFGLLLLGNFLTSQSGGGSIAGAGQSAALKSVSSLISNQLNSLADRFVKGVDLNFGVDSYQSKYAQGGEGGTVTELQVGLSKSLFNDRLSVTVGGNVNVGGSTVAGQNSAAISSEFVIEYKITEEGDYRFRVFRRPDITDVLSQDNDYKTGVGLLFQKSF